VAQSSCASLRNVLTPRSPQPFHGDLNREHFDAMSLWAGPHLASPGYSPSSGHLLRVSTSTLGKGSRPRMLSYVAACHSQKSPSLLAGLRAVQPCRTQPPVLAPIDGTISIFDSDVCKLRPLSALRFSHSRGRRAGQSW
jgi:hypothetical protein